MNLLPPVVAVISLSAFCAFLTSLRVKDLTRVAALTAYALMPAASSEQLETAGLAEAFATPSMIFMAANFLLACERDSIPGYAAVAPLWAVSVIASPGSAYGSTLILHTFAVVTINSSQGSFTTGR